MPEPWLRRCSSSSFASSCRGYDGGRIIDRRGVRYGRLTALAVTDRIVNQNRVRTARCGVCGAVAEYSGTTLPAEGRKPCSCPKPPAQAETGATPVGA